MTQDMRIALTTSLNDQLVAPLRRALDDIERKLKGVQGELQATQRVSMATSRSMAEINGPLMAARQVADLTRNTERAEAAASRLERAWSRAGTVMKGAGSAVASFQAAKFVLAGPMQRAQSYEFELANAANTAYAGKTFDEKRAGMKTLDAAVITSLRQGGGKREDALGALNDMIASGTVDVDQATKILPTVMKYATAGKADPKEIANIAVKALQNGFTVQDVPVMLDKALAAGQAGGFELKDMAKWLPSLLAMGKSAGLSGMKGYERILASAQAGVITAGTRDEAGTNLRDLLQHVSSHALQTSARRMGIDAAGTLAKSIGNGDDTLTALVKLSDYVANKDPRFVALQKKLEAAPTKRDSAGRPVYSDEQMQIMRQQADLLQGSAIGQLFHNQQSVLQLVAERNNRKYIQEVLATSGKAGIVKPGDVVGNVGQENFNLIASTNDFQVQQKENEQLFAQTRALEGANNALGKFSAELTTLYRKFPEFGTLLEGGKLAMGALATAAGAASAALWLLGRGKGAPEVVENAGRAARTSSLMNGPMAAAAGAGAGGALTLAAAIAMPLAIIGAGEYLNYRMNTTEGLTERINTRNERLKELSELAALDGPAKYQKEIDALTAEREMLRERYGEQIGGGRGVVNPEPVKVNVYLDGHEMLSRVETEGGRNARRH